MKVYLLFDEADSHIVEPLVPKLTAEGYDPTHPGTVLVGDSTVANAQEALAFGMPIILFATLRSCGSEWTSRLVHAANREGPNRILVLKMEANALVDHLTFGERVADYSKDPEIAFGELLIALRKRYPVTADQRPSTPVEHEQNPTALHFLETPVAPFEISAAAVNSYRSLLDEDAYNLQSPLLTSSELISRLGLMYEGKMTRAAALLFGAAPQVSVPSSGVQCVRYFGITKADDRDRKMIFGTVLDQLDEAFRFVSSGVSRRERPTDHSPRSSVSFEYPMVSVREILANAMVHRDYADTYRKVHIRIFSDRIEVSSPGTWGSKEPAKEVDIPLSQLGGESVSRNPSLAHALSLVRYLEGEGSGIPKAVSESLSKGAPEPTARFSEGFVRVTIWPYLFDPNLTAELIAAAQRELRSRSHRSSSSAIEAALLVPTDVMRLTSSQRVERFGAPSVAQVESRLIAVEGDPGSGKTVFTQLVAESVLETKAEVPIFTSAREWHTATRKTVLEPLELHFRQNHGLEIPDGFMEFFLSSHPVALFVDGLDEVFPESQLTYIIRSLEELAERYSDLRVIVSIRTSSADALLSSKGAWDRFEILPWSKRQLVEYAEKFLAHRSVHSVSADGLLESVLRADKAFFSFISIPLYFRLLLDFYVVSGSVASSIFSLVEETLKFRYAREAEKRGFAARMLSIDRVQHALGVLALACLESGIDWKRIPKSEFSRLVALEADYSGFELAELQREITDRQHLLISEIGPEELGFTEQVFAEFLAAQALVRAADSAPALLQGLINIGRNRGLQHFESFAFAGWDRVRFRGLEDLIEHLLDALEMNKEGDKALLYLRMLAVAQETARLSPSAKEHFRNRLQEHFQRPYSTPPSKKLDKAVERLIFALDDGHA